MKNPLFVLCLLASTLVSCQGKQSTSDRADQKQAGDASVVQYETPTVNSPSQAMEEPPAPPAPEVPAPTKRPKPGDPVVPKTTVQRKIVRNANLRFRVRDFQKTGEHIELAIKRVGGLIVSTNESKQDASLQNEMVIRVNAARLDTFLAIILKESIFTESKSITAEDVTRRYADVEARIRSKKATEEKYLQLLKQAKNVKDVLEVEQQLAQMREDIEAQEAVFRELKNDVAQSTVQLTYYQQTEASLNPEAPFYVKIWDNLSDGLGLLGSVFLGLFYFLPLFVLLGLFGWLIVRWRRGRKTRLP
ncbi:MAG: DUF4349 domain-containing protein [Cytophagaceae bacterium]|nr:DUF4349 domain-containing protein [Cytophagaceae bacterium]